MRIRCKMVHDLSCLYSALGYIWLEIFRPGEKFWCRFFKDLMESFSELK